MKTIVALILVLALSSCVVGRWTYSYQGRTWVTTLTVFE